MDKSHTRILKYIYKNPYASYSTLHSHFSNLRNLDDILCFLESEKFISFRIECSPLSDEGYEHLYLNENVYLLSLSRGNEYIEILSSSDTRWLITTCIALFAAIGAYRKELALLLQVLEKLLKLLAEN